MANNNQLSTSHIKMPVIFVGHGSPMNAIDDNRWSHGYVQLGDLIPKPDSILAISEVVNFF